MDTGVAERIAAGPAAGPAGVRLREPRLADGGQLWNLARAAGGLDVNSPYAYLVLCRSFARTCVLAEQGGRPVGFLSGFRDPERPETVFVWQVAVCATHRRQGLAGAMLRALVARPACADARYVEATVTPGNRASRALFQRLAAALGAPFRAGGGFPQRLFSGPPHEEEVLLRIGPIPPGAAASAPGRQEEDAHAG